MKNTSKYFLILLLAISFVSICRAQQPDWQQSSQWTLYNVRGAKFYKIAADSLDRYANRPLNDDSMHIFLSHSFALPSDKAPAWMGAFVTSCTLDHKKRKIDISSYGGFFFDETEKKFYSVPENIQRDWLNYLAGSAGALSSKK
jgi:hypothetical protein